MKDNEEIDMIDLEGRDCYAGLDLEKTWGRHGDGSFVLIKKQY